MGKAMPGSKYLLKIPSIYPFQRTQYQFLFKTCKLNFSRFIKRNVLIDIQIYSCVNKIVFFNACENSTHINRNIGKWRWISQLTTSIIVRQFIHSSMTSMLCMHLLNHTKWITDGTFFMTDWNSLQNESILMIIGNDKNPERLSFTYSYFTVKVYIYKYRWKKQSYFYSNLHVAHHHSHQTKRKKQKLNMNGVWIIDILLLAGLLLV